MLAPFAPQAHASRKRWLRSPFLQRHNVWQGEFVCIFFDAASRLIAIIKQHPKISRTLYRRTVSARCADLCHPTALPPSRLPRGLLYTRTPGCTPRPRSVGYARSCCGGLAGKVSSAVNVGLTPTSTAGTSPPPAWARPVSNERCAHFET